MDTIYVFYISSKCFNNGSKSEPIGEADKHTVSVMLSTHRGSHIGASTLTNSLGNLLTINQGVTADNKRFPVICSLCCLFCTNRTANSLQPRASPV